MTSATALDSREDIAVELMPFSRIERLLRERAIDNALSEVAFFRYLQAIQPAGEWFGRISEQ